jgi:porphobilinogen synthase
MRRIVRRPRRLRATAQMRELVRENTVNEADLILPLFVSEKVDSRAPVPSMPGVFQLSIDALIADVAAAHQSGLQSFLLFGIPSSKDDRASGAYADDGIIQRAVRALKREAPGVVIITDVCLCEYMDHGHCGIARQNGANTIIANDESVELLARTAVSHAAAGADIVAPSDMMDGRIGVIRAALDDSGFESTAIMSYAAKFCSSFYGPFREAAESAPQFGDRRSYQMDPANAEEALREVALDVDESADIILIKPGLAYLDVLWRVKERFGMPTAVYNVSGEYAMIKAAAQNGWLDERAAVLEMMTAFKRAGADLIVTYWARQVIDWIKAPSK